MLHEKLKKEMEHSLISDIRQEAGLVSGEFGGVSWGIEKVGSDHWPGVGETLGE